MTRYNFDEIIERRGTSCIKYDFGMQRMGRDDLLPLWVADMDFRLPDEILDAIHKRVSHGIFGYTDPEEHYFSAIKGWFQRHYGWKPESGWITVTPGVVYALAVCVRAYTEPGEAVLIQEPVYYPFRETIELNRRKCVSNDLVLKDGRYEIDFEDFERKIEENQVRLFLLCSPHNPGGRVWTEDELRQMCEICGKHGVQIVDDEIHADFVFPGYHFVPLAYLEDKYWKGAVIATSPSKTFNMAGLQVANIIVPDEKVRRKFRLENAASGYSQGNAVGMTACEAAYTLGDDWVVQLMEYLTGNLEYAKEFFKEKLPEIKLIEPEGTYLIWLDCSGVAKNYPELKALVVDKAKLWLDDGAIFGKKTELFERINIACPRSILAEALDRLERAVHAEERSKQTGYE